MPNPNRTKKTGKKSFSVFLTPRLPDSGILKDYYELVNWFKFHSLFSNNQWLKVRLAKLTTSNDNDYTLTEELSNNKPISYSVSRDAELSRRDLQQHKNYTDDEYFQLGKSIWVKMFQENTPVKGWIFDEGENKKEKITQLFTKDEIENLIEDAEQREKMRKQGITMNTLFSTLESESRSQLANSLGLKDIAAKKMTEDEIRIRNKENQEFHKKISMLSDYPHLLRLTGWIFDFHIKDDISNVDFDIIKLDLSGLPDFIRNQDEALLWTNFSNEIDFKTPWSYLDKSSFAIRYLGKLKKDYFEIENGFMKATGNSYDLVACQFDHQQLKAKLDNSTVEEKEMVKNVVDNRTTDLTSTGIGIKVIKKNKDGASPFEAGINANPDSLNSSISVNGKKNDSANIDDYIIFGHHLDNGYRVDVSMQKTDGTYSPFQSLCWRNADYKIDKSPYSDKKDYIDLLNDFKDEPWISESAQAGKSGTLYVDEELCRWNNWSLTCPHIGNYPQDETTVHENHEFNDLELKKIRPSDKTLTPLRFSRKYKFRIRVVDICGNSANQTDATTSPFEILLKDDSYSNETFYQRLEIANPPELHFIENVFEGNLRNKRKEFIERKLKPEFHGEDLRTLILRTKIKGENIIEPESSVRSVCPPRVTQSFVELHGIIDSLLASNDMSVYKKAAYESVNLDVEIFKPVNEIPFLTDPIINSFDVRVFKNAEKTVQLNSSGTNPNFLKTNNNNYIERIFNSVELKSITGTATEAVTKSNNSISVELKIGSVYKGEIEGIIPDKSNFHLDSLLKNDNGIPVAGKHSQAKELLFINAVQKPFGVDATGKFITDYNLDGTLKKRTPSNPISLAFESLIYSDGKFPISTSGEIKVIAEYEEIICDKNVEQGFTVETGKILVKSFSNFGEDIYLKVSDDSDSTKLLGVSVFKSLEHSFGDTKYRSVKYSIELVSRFKDYFPFEKEFSVFGNFTKTNKEISYKQIENSRKLEALVIDSIVPIFSWTENKNEVVRYQDKFRIYLIGDWFQNGASIKKDASENLVTDAKGEYEFEEVEKVAVFFLDNVDTIPDEYEGLVSEFGKDPSTNINNDRTKGLYKNFFNTNEFIDGTINPNEKINSLLLERGESSFLAPLQTPQNPIDVKAAIFPVKFDSAKKKFYCDIELNIYNEKKLYFPFMKFAVARYLKTSIKEDSKYDYRFSNIVTAPQVQFFPERTIREPKGNFLITSGIPIVNSGESLRNDYFSKKLEFYLILEKNTEGVFDKIIDNKIELNSINSIRIDKTSTSLGLDFLSNKDRVVRDKIETFKPDRLYIEEFEVYNIWDTSKEDDFRMESLHPGEETVDTNYNPRNDIRKRLVFTYQIK